MLDLQVPGRQTFVELKFSKPRIICFLSEAKDILRKKLHKGGCWLIISSEIYGYLIWFLCSFFSFHHEDWCPDFQWRCPWVLASVFAAFGCSVANHSCLLEGHRRAVRKSRMAMLASCVEGTHRGFGDHGGAIEGALWLNTPQYHFLSAAFTQVGAGHLVRLVKPSLLVVPMWTGHKLLLFTNYLFFCMKFSSSHCLLSSWGEAQGSVGSIFFPVLFSVL